MLNNVGSVTPVSHAPYSLPINASPMPLDAPPIAHDPLQDVKEQAEPGLISRFWSWCLQLVGYTNTSPVDDTSRIDIKTAHDQIESVARMQEHHKNLIEDEFTDLSDIGIDKKLLELRIAQIGIQHSQSALTQDQIVKIHELIDETKSKIDEVLKNKLSAAQQAKLFGKIEAGASTLLIATTLVAAAIATVLSGGLAAAPVIGSLEIAATIIAGSTKLMSTGFKYRADRLTADLLGVKEERKSKLKHSQDLMQQNKNAQESVNASWRHAQEIEDHRDKIIKGVLR